MGKFKPKVIHETITVGDDGDHVIPLTDEQIMDFRNRFHEASHGPRSDAGKKNPSTWTKDEYLYNLHAREKTMLDKFMKKHGMKKKNK